MLSPETITQVRERTDIVAVVSESVPSLKRRGRSFVGLCPFHKEKSPSFHVNPDRGFFHCFGCKEAGSVIDFVMKEQGYTFPEAVRALAERAGIEIEEERRERPEVDRAKKTKDDLYAANQLAATFFETAFREREFPARSAAWEELARRGLVPGEHALADEALQAFRIGYAPNEWDALAAYFKKHGISPVVGEAAGLLVPKTSGSGHYDRFRHRLMFAVSDPQGRVVGFSGRALPEGGASAPSKETPKYVNSPETAIYAKGQTLFGLHQGRHAIRQQEEALVVEGNFDVVSLHARGLTHVVAPLGTAFTVDQAKLLRRYAGSVTLLFDGDAAGKKAVRLSREPCMQAGLATKVASLPEGVDPDDYVRQGGGIAALKDLVARARGMLEYLIEASLDEGFASADAYERLGRIEQIAALLASEHDPFVRLQAKAYADRVAGRLDIRDAESFRALEAKVREAVHRAAQDEDRTGQGGKDPRHARVASKKPGAAERREIVGALVEYPSLLDEPEVQEVLGWVEGPAALAVAALRNCLEARTEASSDTGAHGAAAHGMGTANGQMSLDATRFLAQIPPAIQAFASERLAAPRHENEGDARATLLLNAQKLMRHLLGEEKQESARENYKPDADWEASVERLRHAEESVRRKHNLK